MAPSRSRTIVDGLLAAVRESGGIGYCRSTVQSQPRRLVGVVGDREFDIWAFCWTLTPGGRPSLPNEFRIQMTAVDAPLRLNPRGPTVLMGFDPSRRVLAGFDLRRHRSFTEGSPSVQVPADCLDEASLRGLAFRTKATGEVVVGVRPDHFLFYSEQALALHAAAKEEPVRRALEASIRQGRVPKELLKTLPQKRRLLVVSTTRQSRSSSFRERVLAAYDRRCAVTRSQLDLVDAAHILPVAEPGSTDEVTNGICLSPTFHRAFDAGLVFLDTSYRLQINRRLAQDLKARALHAGLEDVLAVCGKGILLPENRSSWPSKKMIRRANSVRAVR